MTMTDKAPKRVSEQQAVTERKEIRKALDETEAPAKVEIPQEDEPDRRPGTRARRPGPRV
jgi:hypothetical protein